MDSAVQVNGIETPYPPGGTVLDLLRLLAIPVDRPAIAVAVNEEVVPRSRWALHRLGEADTVEIIHPVQGG